jgi:hypothetical protein
MNASNHLKYLRIALLVFGLIFILGFWPLTVVWPSGWTWHEEGGSFYLTMMIGLYATLGAFLVIASRDPLAHRSLIWFAVWSSVVHAGIMAVQSVTHPEHAGHLLGDVPALLIVAAVLALLMPRGRQLAANS